MKVMCIDSEAYPKNVTGEEGGLIRNGETYDVIDVYLSEGYIWFVLSIDPNYGYWENCFSRCSDIDETELVKERESELVNQ